MKRRPDMEETGIESIGAAGLAIVGLASLLAFLAAGAGMFAEPPPARVVSFDRRTSTDASTAAVDIVRAQRSVAGDQ